MNAEGGETLQRASQTLGSCHRTTVIAPLQNAASEPALYEGTRTHGFPSPLDVRRRPGAGLPNLLEAIAFWR
jgi:hypothetical protein